VQYPGLQGGGALGGASTPGMPAGSIAASAHRGTYSPVAVAGGAWGAERDAATTTAAAAARRPPATPTGEAATPPRIGARRVGWPTRRTGGRVGPAAACRGTSSRAARWRQKPPTSAVTEVGAQARSPAGHRGRIEPRKSLRAVAARNPGRWGGAEGQAPSGPCDPCGRTVLLSHVTLFAFRVIAILPTVTCPRIPKDTNADWHL